MIGLMIALKKPMYIKTIKIRNPYRSNIIKMGCILAGRNVSRILLPSSGGKGNRLKTANEIFIYKRYWRNRKTGSLNESGIDARPPLMRITLKMVKAQMAIKRLAMMPAAETITLARSLLCQRRGLTGVGLPQPISGIRPNPPIFPRTKLTIGIRRVPMGSV